MVLVPLGPFVTRLLTVPLTVLALPTRIRLCPLMTLVGWFLLVYTRLKILPVTPEETALPLTSLISRVTLARGSGEPANLALVVDSPVSSLPAI